MNEDELVGDVVIPKVSSGNSNNQNEDLLPLGYEALPRSASTSNASENDFLLGGHAETLSRHRSDGSGDSKEPIVGIIMGSDSDLPCMSAAAKMLEEFGVPFELTVVSAHRTPGRLSDYARSARRRGLKVIIAGAGGAAHLPGMVASMTTLPVIGVPVKTSTLSGVDSLYSIVQMPRGVPVATVAIGNAKNAGILAAKILGIENERLAQKIVNFMQNQTKEVMVKAKKLERMGWKGYLDEYEEKKRRAAPKRDNAVGV